MKGRWFQNEGSLVSKPMVVGFETSGHGRMHKHKLHRGSKAFGTRRVLPGMGFMFVFVHIAKQNKTHTHTNTHTHNIKSITSPLKKTTTT